MLKGVREVNERWRMPNGSIAVITGRLGDIAVGVVDGAGGAIHTWVEGKTEAGQGYDLVELLSEESRGRGQSSIVGSG